MPVVIKDYTDVTEYIGLAITSSIGFDCLDKEGAIEVKSRSAWWLLEDDHAKMDGVEEMM